MSRIHSTQSGLSRYITDMLLLHAPFTTHLDDLVRTGDSVIVEEQEVAQRVPSNVVVPALCELCLV